MLEIILLWLYVIVFVENSYIVTIIVKSKMS